MGKTDQQPWRRPEVVAHTQVLLGSYARWLGSELIARDTHPLGQARVLFEAPFVVVSHGTEQDPVLNYGNRAALALWEMDFDTLTRTPSRATAEAAQRSERERMLAVVARQGYVADYVGVRVSASGKRFRIEGTLIWNLVDAQGNALGQAATFAHWHPLTG